MKTMQEGLPEKNRLIWVYLPTGEKILAQAFEGGSGVYSIETEDFDDKRYWCEGELTPGCRLEDIKGWEYEKTS